MKPNNPEVEHEFPFFRVYRNGRVEKFYWPPKKIPPSDDPITGVKSKDVFIFGQPDVSARIFLPRIHCPDHKLPVLLYIHGGGFSFASAFDPVYDGHVRTLAAEAGAIAVSVEYRLAPEHPIPACYDDSWTALQWIASHSNRTGPDPWLNNNADFNRVFIGGDSAGGNISHTLAFRVGLTGLPGIRISGLIMVHPFFGGIEVDDKMWMYMCPSNSGLSDPRIKPPAEDLGRIGCGRVLVFVAEKDYLIGPGRCYYENLRKSGWRGTAELVECEGVGHCFHLWKPQSEAAVSLVRQIASFIKQGCGMAVL